MNKTEESRAKFIRKLTELFRLDRPDLQFGFYRVMHLKAKEVEKFINFGLPDIMDNTFGEFDEGVEQELIEAYKFAFETARSYGVDNPDETEPVKRAKNALENFNRADRLVLDVYDHLHRFFDRYYDNGDFVTRRYYARETSTKSAPFAIPYNGEDIKLHWANADQFYIKSAENFTNFAFDLSSRSIVNEGESDEDPTYKVYFHIVDADEDAHNNVKSSENTKRYFILHLANPLQVTDVGELVVNFEYRIDPEKTGQDRTWRSRRNAQTVSILLETLEQLIGDNHKHHDRLSRYYRLLSTPAPTAADKNRTVLAKYVNQFTERNTRDYFIHKDLAGFLNRELAQYIKNELLDLDVLGGVDSSQLEKHLGKARAVKQIATQIISFLAQLENFQKKLWLKKKFVVETNYCITLDRIPEELYSEIVANQAQVDEWVRLFSINEMPDALHGDQTELALTPEFLAKNPNLVLDTQFFDEAFKEQLLASISNFDEQLDGLLVHSENFQALEFIQARYSDQIKTIYIDPPYNTEQDRNQGKFLYKDNFESSSWLSMMTDRISLSSLLLSDDGTFFSSIDHNEIAGLKYVLEEVFGKDNFEGLITWRRRHNQPNDPTKMIGMVSEYLLTFSKDKEAYKAAGVGKLDVTGDFSNPDNDPRGDWASKPWKVGSGQGGTRYEIISPSGVKFNEIWMGDRTTFESLLADDRIIFTKNGNGLPRKKYFKNERIAEGQSATNWWHHEQFGHNQGANDTMHALMGYKNSFSNPKPVELLRGVLLVSNTVNRTVLDFFAGSGTTGHAVINLNREDAGRRKYILVEMGDYFDDVLKPRISKAIYASEWKQGKPLSRDNGVSHCYKYIRLESYEDALNNLDIREDAQVRTLFDENSELWTDYVLHYMLDAETTGSQSLLNIDMFTDPFSYYMNIKKPGSDAQISTALDLVETFNYLLGLHVTEYGVTERVGTEFTRAEDPELPPEVTTKLVLKDELEVSDEGPWWFRKVEGVIAGSPSPEREKVLIIWRKLSGDLERDNLVLDEWFSKHYLNNRPVDFDVIYVNGSNNLQNLRKSGERWSVKLLEAEFMDRMWDLRDF